MSTHSASKEETPGREASGVGGGDDSTEVVKISLDPNESLADYAAARARGAVVPVAFVAAKERREGEAERAEKNPFLERPRLLVCGHDEVLQSLQDNRFSVDPRSAMTPEQRAGLPPTIEEFRPFREGMLSMDPPEHTRLRKLIQPSFSPARMEALRPRIQKLADDLLDAAERAAEERGERAPDRRMDLIEAFAYPLPVRVISDMLGIPLADRPQVQAWTETVMRAERIRVGQADPETRDHLRRLFAYLRALFQARRGEAGDDMISQLVQAEEDGDKLSEDELLSTVCLLYLAGHVTTVSLIGNGVFALLGHPGELAKVRADLGMVKAVVEETLRYWGPMDYLSRRIAREDLELGGRQIPKGEPLTVGLAAANRDPARFADPDVFDISRPDADRHVAFGKGIHLCVGAPLARLEGQIAFETLLRRYPDLRLGIPAEEVRWGKSFLRRLAQLPVLF